MDYSVIIPAYNEAESLPRVLGSVQVAMAETGYEGELLVVDNNSTDDTAQVAEHLGARVVFEPHNQISRARNCGAEAASGRWLIFIDADTVIVPGLLLEAILRLESREVIGGGSIVHFDRELDWMAEKLLGLWTFFSLKARLAAGSFFYVTREAFEAVGGFSEKVYASEEIWLSKALKKECKKRGMRFEIITAFPVITSSRKMDWFGSGHLFLTLVFFTVFPFALRSRRFCRIWYERPD